MYPESQNLQKFKEYSLLLSISMQFHFLFFLLIIFFQSAFAQLTPSNKKELKEQEVVLQHLADTMLEATSDLARFNSCYTFIPKLVTALKIPGSFEYLFDSLDAVSILYPEDNSFRVFTWPVVDDNYNWRYYGVIQMNQPEKLKLFPLYDYSNLLVSPQDSITNHHKWYGAIYYNIIVNKHRRKKYYTLFGWDGNDRYSTKKIMEILSFDKNGEPVFGAPIIKIEKDSIINRFVLEYKKDAGVSLNYNDILDKIIYDNLIPESEATKNILNTYVPDGSYKGFEFKRGKWHYIDKIFTDIFETPPGPNSENTNKKK